MGRNRVLSFMTAFGAPKSPTTTSFSGPQEKSSQPSSTASSSPQHAAAPARDSPAPLRARTETWSSSRPMSMVQTYQPPLMEIAGDTIPELQPIFTFLNSHVNKLYQEGYFLKLNDLDSQGRANADRSWTESFAQLVGTVMSLWDASALDVAGQDGEVAPTFINLADASIKMIETLPTRSQDVEPLQNVLSISTAAKNRYLLHFNSLHSLTQWTAAIRLAMFENATLQEAYTGSLLAGKGKLLNNIRVIMDRTRLVNEDWTRVRFGAGTPWRRCWCVITPPSEKEVQKQQKQLRKKSAYERTAPLKGNVKFYDTKKTKKAQPIATINDAYSAYAIYPQSKPLIDQSTLIKVEGSITIHSTPETTTEGFVFVMPEVHPAVSGFEMMLRYIFPIYDVFALYGRPSRLIADTLDTRSLMFALPQEKRYGYLEILDVAGLIHEVGSQSWSEREWRKRMKELTSTRMTKMTTGGRPRSRASSYREYRNSVVSRTGTLRYEDGASIKSTPSLLLRNGNDAPPMPPPHADSAMPGESPFGIPVRPRAQHQRSFSESNSPMAAMRNQRSQRDVDLSQTPPRFSQEKLRSGRPPYEQAPPPQMSMESSAPPPPPPHGLPVTLAARNPQLQRSADLDSSSNRSSSESERRYGGVSDLEAQAIQGDMRPAPPPASVAAPPVFTHEPGARPQKRPGVSPDLRRANSRLSVTTLAQLADAGKNSTVGGGAAAAGAAAAWRSNSGSGSQLSRRPSDEQGQRGVNNAASKSRNPADLSTSAEGLVLAKANSRIPKGAGLRNISSTSSQQDPQDAPYYKDNPLLSSYDLLSPSNSVSRAESPLSQATSRKASPLSQPVKSTPLAPTALTTDQSITSNGSKSYVFSESPQSVTSKALPEEDVLSRPLERPISITSKPLPEEPPQSRPQPSRSSTSRSINRKPVPAPPLPAVVPSQEPAVSERSSSLGSLNGNYIDEDVLAQVLNGQHANSITSDIRRNDRYEDASVYDNDSTGSPDYASTRKSTETGRSRPSADKPRRGVLKTVGTVEPEVPKDFQVGDAHYRPGATPEPQLDTDIPIVDFGPTQALNPGKSSRPTTSGTMKQGLSDETISAERIAHTPSPRGEGSAEGRRSSAIYPASQSNGFAERPPSRNLTTPDPQARVPPSTDNDNRRSVAWQPGAMMGASSPGNRQSITPEQFVEQRAAANRITPVYAHGRYAHNRKGSAATPTGSRQASGEYPLQQQRNSPSQQQRRQSSYISEPPARPQSRTASGDYTPHLSAREQEHVARVTGSPLINMAASPNRGGPPQGGGLIGAIEAREKEKKEMKQGLSGHMVQHAIAQRQQHAQGHQQRQSSYGMPTPPFATPNPQYAMPGGFPPSPTQASPYGGPQQQYGWTPQQQQHFAQYSQQQGQQWVPPGMQQYQGMQQQSPYQQQYQHAPQFQQSVYQQGTYGQGQPQYYGPYFGNGQGNH